MTAGCDLPVLARTLPPDGSVPLDLLCRYLLTLPTRERARTLARLANVMRVRRALRRTARGGSTLTGARRRRYRLKRGGLTSA